MYLQSLEVFGFKSFAPKTTFNFHRGVTAIVGPNGCGKSNVLDAMRWVLGEQSAKALRGGEMSDVIFSGTDSRPAVGMAEVSLTFAECERELGVEWNEVRITRKVFRDGNSEYFLNKTPCRLRDIHQLFMDTGIGRTAYSIMEQGKIDLILSSKPEDRRAIFEEAAGITRFKSQRREALRKLEATDANLLRVTDVVKEVKRQIGSLQRQAGKARRYQSLVTDLRTLETHSCRRQFEALDASLGESVAELTRLRNSQEKQDSDIADQELALTSQRSALEAAESRANEARQEVQNLRSHVSNAENRVQFNRERIAENTSLIARYENDIAVAAEKLRTQEEEIHDTDLAIEEISGALRDEQTRLDEKTKAVNALSAERVTVENSVQTIFGAIAKIENRLGALRGERASAEAERDASAARLAVIASDIEQVAAAAQRLDAQHSTALVDAASAGADVGKSVADLRKAEAALAELEGEREQVEERLWQTERELAEKESKLNIFRQLNEEGEGFTSGTQALLRGLDNPAFFKPALGGALASHLNVGKEFVPAVEAALGPNLQAVIVKDRDLAESAIKTLVAQKLGRVSLALREFISSDSVDSDTFPDGAIGWLSEKVSAPDDLAPLVHRLLRNVALVADLDTATQLRISAPGVSFVTLAGEFLSDSGILHGGSAGEKNGSVLRRNAQIAELNAEAAILREAMAEISERQNHLTERADAAKAAVSDLRGETEQKQLRLSKLQGEIGLLEREARDAHAKNENLRTELESIRFRRDAAALRIDSLTTDAETARTELTKLQNEQSEFQIRLDSLRSEESALGADLGDLRVRVAREKQRQESLADQRQPMASRLEEIRDLIAQRERDIDLYKKKISDLSLETERVSAEIDRIRDEATGAEAQVSELLAQRAARAAEIAEVEATLRILRRQLADCQQQAGQQEVRQTQLQLRIDNLNEHVARRYDLDLRQFQPDSYALLCTLRDQGKRQKSDQPETATAPEAKAVESPAADEKIDWQKIEELVRELNQRLDAMGPVNIDAIQEYDELEERHTFLEKQLADLNQSKTELVEVIGKINVTSRKLFAETFEAVRQNFQEMFIEIFGGGRANLVLVDEADPLESGIDIIAKPPGKQLQSISLLSGGEKTMTAVALLFSIYMVKPSPFCVLDEMDAPLDESNINRFIKILDRFVSQSQFIVITHNKRTIARADVLYGVTMEEHGVSKLVGVKFSRREESEKRNDLMGTVNLSERPIPSVADTFGRTDELHSEKVQTG
ncbi:MAG: chromosome segregation protein SMC [Verrucomicrobiota bacterium]|nr:chromosome segregation protein SMC [Verrucomicrobiota bacterium]